MDAIHEYLLLKGVEAVAIHGGKGTSHSSLSQFVVQTSSISLIQAERLQLHTLPAGCQFEMLL